MLLYYVSSWTVLKLEDAIQKVDNRSERRTTIHSADYHRNNDGWRQDKILRAFWSFNCFLTFAHYICAETTCIHEGRTHLSAADGTTGSRHTQFSVEREGNKCQTIK